MTNYNELKYKGIKKCLFNQTDEDMCIYRYLCPKKVKGKKRVLIGKKEDYLMLYLMILRILKLHIVQV